MYFIEYVSLTSIDSKVVKWLYVGRIYPVELYDSGKGQRAPQLELDHSYGYGNAAVVGNGSNGTLRSLGWTTQADAVTASMEQPEQRASLTSNGECRRDEVRATSKWAGMTKMSQSLTLAKEKM